MISPSLIESPMFFFPVKAAHLLYIFLKHMKSFWFNRLFMDGLSCLLAVCKIYGNANGKGSKDINAIVISTGRAR